MYYGKWIIPAGTAVGISALYVLHDPLLFPSPSEFKPERWLEAEISLKLERYLISFGRGARSCVGVNLAYVELYTICATLFRRFPGIKLFETGRQDVETVHDYFAALSRFGEGSVGLQVKIS
jgi:cytochrome P450